MDVQTTLNFYGRTEEAIAFYGRVIGAETLFMMRFSDRPGASPPEKGLEKKIFHATFRIGATEVMASDCGCESPAPGRMFSGFSLALRLESPEKAKRVFSALGEGGRIEIPLTETFFTELYGIVVDRFGISWKIMLEPRERNGR